MKPFPKRLKLADLPTRIEKLERFSERTGLNVYVKRDDMSGMEWSGNKIRKLEFSIQEALDRGADTLITCGGIQSITAALRLLRQRGWACVPACCSARTIPTRSWTETISLIRCLAPTYALFRRRIIATAGAK